MSAGAVKKPPPKKPVSKAFGLAELGRKIALEQATKAPAK